MPALTKEDLDKFKNVDPTAFLSKPEASKEDENDPPASKKDDDKPTPAKELKNQLEKTKKERADIQKKFEEAEARIKELEAKTGEASELEALRPVADYLKKKAGKLDADVVEKRRIALEDYMTRIVTKLPSILRSELFNEFIDIPMAIADTNFGSYNFVTNLPAGYVQMPL